MKTYKDKVIIQQFLQLMQKLLMANYNIPEGKILGNKLKLIEETWVQVIVSNISNKQIRKNY